MAYWKMYAFLKIDMEEVDVHCMIQVVVTEIFVQEKLSVRTVFLSSVYSTETHYIS